MLVHRLVIVTCSRDGVETERVRKEVQKLVPLLALLFERENRYQNRQNFQVEYKVEEMLRCILLPSHLEVTELQSFKVTSCKLRQEV